MCQQSAGLPASYPLLVALFPALVHLPSLPWSTLTQPSVGRLPLGFLTSFPLDLIRSMCVTVWRDVSLSPFRFTFWN